MTNHDNVALRTKLLEALHTAPHKMKTTGLTNHGEPTDNQNVRYQRGDAASHKQNSGPSHADSFAQNKAPPNTGSKLQNQISHRKKPAAASIPDTEQKVQEKFAFSFDHREEKDGSIKSHSSKYGSPRSERKKIPADSKGKHRKEVGVSANGRGKRMPPRKKEKDFAYSPPKAKKRGVQMPKDTPKGSSDDTRETTESPDTESPSSMEDVEVEKLTESPVEEKDARCAKEQQERLKRLHDKFKEEVNQQVLDCRTTIEELDAYQLELKGTAERQRASHKKLLMQAEEAMKVQLSDADTCIQAVNKEATHKMSGLKLVLDEWIAEGQVC